MQLYKPLVRPHSEYCLWFWSLLHEWKDEKAWENMQKWLTRMLPGLTGIRYKEMDKIGSFSPNVGG